MSDNPSTLEEEMRLSEARQKEIEEEIKKSALTSPLESVTQLRAQYKDASNFLTGVDALEKEHDHIRIIRGDGNCYYRAFLYRLVETLLQGKNQAESQRILEYCKTTSWEQVKKAGYEEMTIEVFYEELVELMEDLVAGKIDADTLHAKLNEENSTSDYATWYMRVVTATHLKNDPDRFLPFIMAENPGMDIPTFCQRFVEPMGKECEQVQVLALAEAFGVQVQIEYLDGHALSGGKLARHTFGPENALTTICVLYRPGHYDIIYPKE